GERQVGRAPPRGPAAAELPPERRGPGKRPGPAGPAGPSASPPGGGRPRRPTGPARPTRRPRTVRGRRRHRTMSSSLSRNGWLVAIELVFETHSTTVDNEQGRATGWLPGQLSERGRVQACELGRRRSGDGIAAVFSSDLARAAETASVAFTGSAIPVLYDWRLRECDYGQRNGMPAAELYAGRREHLDQAYPGGE